jgi:hypothetical protein
MKISNITLFRFGCAMLMLSAFMVICGCSAPEFLTDLEQIIPVAISAVTGILAILGSATGNPAIISAAAAANLIANKVEAGLSEIEKLIAQYKANPNDTLLEQIEGLISTANADLASLLQVEGLPQASATLIAGVVQAVTAQLEALLSVLPVFKTSTAGQQLAVTKPVSAATFKAQVKTALAAKAA